MKKLIITLLVLALPLFMATQAMADSHEEGDSASEMTDEDSSMQEEAPTGDEEAEGMADQEEAAEEKSGKMDDEEEAAGMEAASEAEEVVGNAQFNQALTKLKGDMKFIADSSGALVAAAKDEEGATSLDNTYKRFTTASADATASVEAIRKNYTEFEANVKAGLDAWQASIASIGNKDIRKSSEKRWKSISELFADIQKATTEAGAQYDKVLTDSGDIQKFLSFDLTKGGIDQISDELKDLEKNSNKAAESLGKVVELMKELPDLSKAGKM